MAYLQHNRFGFKDNSVDANIPDNDVARLMYYFNCVCSAIQYNDSDVRRFRNYRNWASLSFEEIRVLLALCITISPDVLDGKVFFHSDALCGNSQNKFYEISQVSNQLLAVESIVIAGRRCRVSQIMTYKMSWMYNYYLNPVQRLASRFSSPTSRSGTCIIS
ncbi:unnamed protein product [Rotaria socialis]|uniref:Uncharacterized protein n=1 Tax=Rotaria socialis TaxID=392032 RepID=A0A820XR46_9BILA|nr:unnamed protein product [Rotaria socialis]CAF4537203.1 unnamed protein product [Rotaria socialis]